MCVAEGSDPDSSVKRICRVQGIAVCWSPDAVYYIPLNPAAPGVDKFVAGMMANKRAQKVTFDLKSQMVALLSGSLLHTSAVLCCTVLYRTFNTSYEAKHSGVPYNLLYIIVYSASLPDTPELTAPTLQFVFLLLHQLCSVVAVTRFVS